MDLWAALTRFLKPSLRLHLDRVFILLMKVLNEDSFFERHCKENALQNQVIKVFLGKLQIADDWVKSFNDPRDLFINDL